MEVDQTAVKVDLILRASGLLTPKYTGSMQKHQHTVKCKENEYGVDVRLNAQAWDLESPQGI